MVMIWKSMSYAEEAKEEQEEMLACDTMFNYVTFTEKKPQFVTRATIQFLQLHAYLQG